MASQLKYENVQRDDRDDSSITEVESLIGDEKQMAAEEFRYMKKSKRVTCLSILMKARSFLDTILLLVIVGLLLRDQSQKATPKTSEHEVGGDMTGVGPHCELQKSCRLRPLTSFQIVSTQVTQFHINQTFAPYNTSNFFKKRFSLPGMD